jgi:hypothetical protein
MSRCRDRGLGPAGRRGATWPRMRSATRLWAAYSELGTSSSDPLGVPLIGEADSGLMPPATAGHEHGTGDRQSGRDCDHDGGIGSGGRQRRGHGRWRRPCRRRALNKRGSGQYRRSGHWHRSVGHGRGRWGRRGRCGGSRRRRANDRCRGYGGSAVGDRLQGHGSGALRHTVVPEHGVRQAPGRRDGDRDSVCAWRRSYHGRKRKTTRRWTGIRQCCSDREIVAELNRRPGRLVDAGLGHRRSGGMGERWVRNRHNYARRQHTRTRCHHTATPEGSDSHCVPSPPVASV